MNLREYYLIWSDSWKLFRKYAEKFPLSDQDWSEAIEAASEFSKTHGGDEFLATKAAVLALSMLEHEHKKWERDHSEKAETENWSSSAY